MTHWLATHPRWRKALGIGGQLLLLVAVYFGVRAWMQRDMPSGPAPGLVGLTPAGEQLSLADYRGQPVLLHFWASWCRICALEQDAIDAIHRDWPVLTVAMQSGDAESVSRHLAAEGLAWATLVDEDGVLARQFGVKAVPTTFVVDADGMIRFRETGFSTEWGLRSRLWWARGGR